MYTAEYGWVQRNYFVLNNGRQGDVRKGIHPAWRPLLRMKLMHQKALEYLARGYSILPIGLDKRPLLNTWKPLQTRHATEEEVEEWFTKWPDMNLGIVTGRISDITVLDLDVGHDTTTSPSAFPETLTHTTPSGGIHLIYKYADGFTVSANAYPQFPHTDVRGDFGYIVAPPSVTKYQKDGNGAGGLYTVSKAMLPAPFPAHLFPAIKPKNKPTDAVGAGAGKRNDSLTSTIGTFLLTHPEKQWQTVVLPAIEKIAATMVPPLPLDEVRSTFNSVVSLEHNRRIATSGGEPNDDEETLRTMFIKNKAQGTFDLARYIVKKFDIITVGEKEYEMYVYRNGMYAPALNEVISPEIQRVLGPLVTKSAKLETLHKIYDMTMSNRSIFETASLDLIPLLNGVYDRKNKVLLPHSPEYRFTYQFPVIYDPQATCSKTSAFFDQILDPQQRATVEEWIGYYFYRNYMFKKAIIFVGEGDTGKTTLLETIDFLLGKANISSVSLQKMTSDKFAAAHMFEKHGNLVDELSAKDISDTGNFKIATGGGSISGEYKFGNQFSFHNFSKLTFACNRIPDVKEYDDDAYFNRWMVIRFEYTIENKIPNFIKTLTIDEERSGLFNLAMAGLDRLLEQGKFTYASDAVDTKKEMLRSGSSIAMFASDKLTHDLGNEMTKEEMYEEYAAYCKTKEVPAQTIKMLGTRLPYYITYMSDGLMTMPGKSRVRGWRNVKVITSDVLDEQFNAF